MTDFWASQPQRGDFAPMASAGTKDWLVENDITFDVVAIRQATSQEYGDFWAVEFMYDGSREALAFGHNPARDEQMNAMQSFLASNGGAAIPARLVSFKTKNGFTAYSLDRPKQSPQLEMALSSAGQPAYAHDDEPPF